MNEEEPQVLVEGLEDSQVNDLYEDDEEDQTLGDYKTTVEKQNDALIDNKWKQFLSLCSTDAPQPPKDQRLTLEKSTHAAGKASLPSDIQEVVAADMPELLKLVSSIKNNVLGMRVKIAAIVDRIRLSEANPSDSISLINLRVEVLAEYWSYLCLLAICRVIYLLT